MKNFILLFFICSLYSETIGELVVVGKTAYTKHFTTEPGSKGLPGDITQWYSKGDKIKVVKIFNWVYLDSRLKGSHTWYQVDNGGWLWQSTNIQFHNSYSIDYLVSDEWFVNTKISFDDFLKFMRSFKNNQFTDNQIKYIYDTSLSYKINPLIVLSKCQQESAIVVNSYTNRYEFRLNRCMGYGAQKQENRTFEKQIKGGTEILRKYFDLWAQGKKITFLQNLGTVIPKNAATYSLYIYCPVYGEYKNYYTDPKNNTISSTWVGNKAFVSINNEMRNRFTTVCY